MFSRLRKKQTPVKTVEEKEDDLSSSNTENQQGFICPMCMEALPGPAELQMHFEKVHSDGGESTENLIDVEDETDALPESVSTDLLASPSLNEFPKARLELSFDANAPDTDKQLFIMQQELSETEAELKEEKWYSNQLKIELDKTMKERDKLEEDKALSEDEFSSQLRSAEQGYLVVVEENNKLKDEIKFADYNTTKERHDKLKLEMIGYKNQTEEEIERRKAIEENFKLLQNEYDKEIEKSKSIELQLQARPSSASLDVLHNETKSLAEQKKLLEETNKKEIENINKNWKEEISQLKTNILNLENKVKEVSVEKSSKEEQISSLQAAMASASSASDLSRQHTNEKNQQVLDLQHKVNTLEGNIKENTDELSKLNKQINELKIEKNQETNEKEKYQSELSSLRSTLDELKVKETSQLSTIKELETNIGTEKQEITRLEKERIELIAKIEAGEGTDTVIQQLSQEKTKLLDVVASFEKSMSDQIEKHNKEMTEIRTEKKNLQDELQKVTSKNQNNEKLINDLKNEIKEKDDRINEIKNELKIKSEDLFQHQSDALTEKTKLSESLAISEKEMTQMKADVAMRDVELNKVKDELKSKENSATQQTSWIEAKNKSINEMTSKLSSLQDVINQKNAEIGALKTDLDDKTTAFKTAQELSNNAETKLKEENEKLSKDKQNQETEFADVSKMKETLELEIEQLKIEKHQMEEVETNLITKTDELNKEIETIQQKLNDKITKVIADNEDQLKIKLKEHEDEILDLVTKQSSELYLRQEELDNVQTNLSNTEINLNGEIEGRSKAEQQILTWETKHAKLEASLEQKDEVLHDIQSKLEIAEEELKKPCNSCKNYEIQLCRLQEATKDQSGQIEKLNEKLSTSEERLKCKTEEIESLTLAHEKRCTYFEMKLNELNTQLEELQKEKSDKEEEFLALEKELEEKKNDLIEIETKKNVLTQTKENLEEEIAKLTKQSEEHQNEILDLKATVEVKDVEINKTREELQENKATYNEERAKQEEAMCEVQEKLLEEMRLHEESKDASAQLQTTFEEECISLQNKLAGEKKKTEELIISTKQTKEELNKEKERFKENYVEKIKKEFLNKDRQIDEFKMKIEAVNNENTELKGDITVLEAQIQNSSEEKRALLERVLSSEDQHKKTKQKLSETNRKLDQALSGLQELGQENQNLQVQHTIKSTRQWETDKEVNVCKKCDKQFTLTVRKHHCRSCGCIFCKECSAYSAVMASSKKPVRVCETCSVELSGLRGTSVRRLSNSSMISSSSVR